MNATAKQLRFETKTLLQSVARGEEVTITMRGKPVARLVTIDRGMKKNREVDTVFGMWSDRVDLRDVPGYVRKVRKGRF
jgi:prevent-host-death family protein